MNYLFFDTETTGKADFKADAFAAHQPDLIQIAASLCTEDGTQTQSFEFLVRPNGWEVEPGAAELHGMTTEFCEAYGLPVKSVLHAFNMLCRHAHVLVAYNIKFDLMIMEGAFYRADISHCMGSLNLVCAMLPMTDICQIPSDWGGYKWPKLIEAHEFLFGCGFDSAHNAMADVDAMKRVFFESRKRGLIAI